MMYCALGAGANRITQPDNRILNAVTRSGWRDKVRITRQLIGIPTGTTHELPALCFSANPPFVIFFGSDGSVRH